MKKIGNYGLEIVKKGYDAVAADAYISRQKAEYEAALAEQKQRIFELKNALAAAEQTIKDHKEKSSIVSKAIINAVTKADEIEKLTTLKYRQELERLKSFHDKWMGYYNKILQSYPLDDDLTAASRFNMQMKKILEGTEEGGSSSELSKTASELERTFEAENERIANRTVKPGKVTVKASVKAAPVKTEEKKPAAKKSASEKMSEQRKSLIENGFDPIARISRYLEDAANIEMEEDSETSAAASAVPQAPAPQPPAAKNGDYADRSALGFSFEEALNPKEDLASIMKELGLFSDDE